MTSFVGIDWRALRWAREFHEDPSVRRDFYQQWIEDAVEEGGTGDFSDGWVGDSIWDAADRYPGASPDELASLVSDFEMALWGLFTAEVDERVGASSTGCVGVGAAGSQW